jgi:hypothetical protein
MTNLNIDILAWIARKILTKMFFQRFTNWMNHTKELWVRQQWHFILYRQGDNVITVSVAPSTVQRNQSQQSEVKINSGLWNNIRPSLFKKAIYHPKVKIHIKVTYVYDNWRHPLLFMLVS